MLQLLFLSSYGADLVQTCVLVWIVMSACLPAPQVIWIFRSFFIIHHTRAEAADSVCSRTPADLYSEEPVWGKLAAESFNDVDASQLCHSWLHHKTAQSSRSSVNRQKQDTILCRRRRPSCSQKHQQPVCNEAEDDGPVLRFVGL